MIAIPGLFEGAPTSTPIPEMLWFFLDIGQEKQRIAQFTCTENGGFYSARLSQLADA